MNQQNIVIGAAIGIVAGGYFFTKLQTPPQQQQQQVPQQQQQQQVEQQAPQVLETKRQIAKRLLRKSASLEAFMALEKKPSNCADAFVWFDPDNMGQASNEGLIAVKDSDGDDEYCESY